MKLKPIDIMSFTLQILIKFGNNPIMLKIDGSIRATFMEEKMYYIIEWKKIKQVMESNYLIKYLILEQFNSKFCWILEDQNLILIYFPQKTLN